MKLSILTPQRFPINFRGENVAENPALLVANKLAIYIKRKC